MAARSELSKKNKYWVEKNRYYELKYFCMQYSMWKKLYLELDGLAASRTYDLVESSNIPSDPTSRLAEERLYYFDKMQLVEQTALAADADLASYILNGVTKGLSYDSLKFRFDIPCGKDMYYDRYRRFFWLLDRARN